MDRQWRQAVEREHQTATVDTAGMAPGSYSANATITDPKEKKNNAATCTANFTIKQPQPPVR